MITLYDYCRSSAAYRLRVALNLKGLAYQQVSVNLLKGEQQSAEYKKLNPQGLVPALKDGEQLFTQSIAILEYLEQQYPEVKLLPDDLAAKTQVRAVVQTIASDIHPIDNLRVLKYLVGELGATEAQKLAWYHHWIIQGFTAIEQVLAKHSGQYCFGDEITLADVCLVPQVFNANRFKVDMTPFANIVRVVENCEQLDAFIKAQPANQPDA